MYYKNPVIKGYYPDPSVCRAGGKYYLAASSFQYFPGVPLFESEDLINWTPIGYALTRKEQIMLDGIESSGGVFAPTIRYNNGRFYVVTTNDTTHQNFYVYTDDIYGEWSDPIYVDQGGIDPSLLFDNGHVYFISNGTDDNGIGGVIQCEIDIDTGRKLTPSRCLWKGTGGRFLEGPHMYKTHGKYYLFAAEGGTEYGHMMTCARGDDVWGPFESCPNNPILTNRDKAPYIIQGIGHGELIEEDNGDMHIMCLGFRQIHKWMSYHHLGREVFLVPAEIDEDGWIIAGYDGTCSERYEINKDTEQKEKLLYTFENTLWNTEWQYLRHPDPDNYIFEKDSLKLTGSDVKLDDVDSPTFICLHQKDFCFNLHVKVKAEGENGFESGVTLYYCETEHYDIAIRRKDDGYEAVLKLNIGGIRHEQATAFLSGGEANLLVTADNYGYMFLVNGIALGGGPTKFLSSEVCGGFTGTVIGLYAVGEGTAEFTDYELKYREEDEF